MYTYFINMHALYFLSTGGYNIENPYWHKKYTRYRRKNNSKRRTAVVKKKRQDYQ